MSDLPRDSEHGRRLARAVRKEGIEVTPEEALNIRERVYAKMRARLRDLGFVVPDSDVELRETIARTIARDPELND